MSKSGPERREHPRIEASFQLDGRPDEGGVVARMVANNLSLTGLLCTASADFPELTRLAVRLLLPFDSGTQGETRPLDLEAVVVRREDATPAASGEPRFRLALFFTRVDDADRQRLASFLALRADATAVRKSH